MTDEQIKQNAEEYYDKLGSITIEVEGEPNSIVEAYIAGAHSRDEEINALHDLLDVYERELDKLRNPWISVEDRLPEDDVEVIGMTDRGWVFLIRRNSNEWCGTEYRELLGPEITHWMPIPELKKGE